MVAENTKSSLGHVGLLNPQPLQVMNPSLNHYTTTHTHTHTRFNCGDLYPIAKLECTKKLKSAEKVKVDLTSRLEAAEENIYSLTKRLETCNPGLVGAQDPAGQN